MTDREIILAIFNPAHQHKDGCLVHDRHIKPRGPCTCGFSEIVADYRAAVREAREIASKHYGSAWQPQEATA
jgi:hypothetical protein